MHSSFDQAGADLNRPATVTFHPEEMKATVEFRIGNRVLNAFARTTPAGVVATGVMVSSILVSVAFLVRAASGHRRRRPI